MLDSWRHTEPIAPLNYAVADNGCLARPLSTHAAQAAIRGVMALRLLHVVPQASSTNARIRLERRVARGTRRTVMTNE